MKYFLLFFLLFFNNSFTQENRFNFDSFTLNIKNHFLIAESKNGEQFYEKKFTNPSGFTADLDGDNIDEFLILDSLEENQQLFFTLYIYNTIDAFNLIDSIFSGIVEPYNIYSEEIEGTIIISGNPAFEIFNTGEIKVLPINCWRYESGELFQINDEIYNNFILENEGLTEIIENQFSINQKNCITSLELKSAIASAFTNFINAGEEAIASQFLKKYYLCEDIIRLKNQLMEILNKGNMNENGVE